MTTLNRDYVDYVRDIAGITPRSPRSTSYGITGTPGMQTQGPTAVKGVSDIKEDVQTSATGAGTASQGLYKPGEPQVAPGGTYGINLKTYTQNPAISGIYSTLFAPVTQGLSKASTGLQETASSFLGSAGPTRRTWAGIGGEQTLEQVLAGSKPEAEGVSLVKASYGGPTELSKESLAGIYPTIQELQERQRSFYQPGGVEDLLSRQSPGLTPGELKTEAERLRIDPGYLSAQKAAQEDISRLVAEYQTAQGEAKAIAAQRAADEAEIARSAIAGLSGKRGAMETAWDQLIATEKARNAAAQAAYDKFIQTGDLNDLRAMGATNQFDVEQFNTPAVQNLAEGMRIREAINAKYADIKDIPLMTLQITKKGRETLGFPEKWWTDNQNKYTPAQMATIKERARLRQKELEDAGFIGGRYGNDRYVSVMANTDAGAQAGKYSELMPLYFGEDFKPEDIRAYVGPLNLASPTRQNISTEDQRAIYNRIQRILSVIENTSTIDNPDTAYKAAQLMADVGGYLEDEKMALEEHKGDLTTAQNEWFGMVRNVRRRYKKLKKKKKLGRILGGIGAFAGFGISGPAGGAAGYYIGKKTGEAVG